MSELKYYDNYLSCWFEGIKSEISFWDSFISSSGKNCKLTPEVFQDYVSDKPKFRLEKDLEGNKTKFLDVGSGPFSRCGFCTNKTDLDFYAVDPLASIYNFLKEKYGIKSAISPVTGMVETLTDQFEADFFDIVHMSNSLDHCCDPLFGLYQMLYVCKTGGKVILRHSQNEAENENYEGFHQWNLCVDNGVFYIWRKDRKYDIRRELQGIADIESITFETEDCLSKRWKYNKVVIRKKAGFDLPYNVYQKRLTLKLMEELISLNYQSFLAEACINKNKIESLLYKALFKNPNSKISVYGAGEFGRLVYSIVQSNNLEVNNVFDSNPIDKGVFGNLKPVKFDESLISDNEIIFIASLKFKQEIKDYIYKNLSKHSSDVVLLEVDSNM